MMFHASLIFGTPGRRALYPKIPACLLALALGFFVLSLNLFQRFKMSAFRPCLPAEFSVRKDSIIGVAARASAKRLLLLPRPTPTFQKSSVSLSDWREF
jgi:hypothetical protein